MGDGRWRCEVCGAGERCKHDEDCVECLKCRGLGYFFVSMQTDVVLPGTGDCRHCKGVGRIPVPGSDLDPQRGVTHDLRDHASKMPSV